MNDEHPGTPSVDEGDAHRTRRIRRGDLIISPILILGGLWFAVDAFRMSYTTVMSGEARISTSPGLLPFLVSVLIVICSIRVFLHALRSGADLGFLRPAALFPRLRRLETWTAPLVMVMFAIYVFLLIGRVPFVVATITFGVAMMLVFQATRWYWILLINVGYAGFVIYCFTRFAHTRFPMGLFG